MVTGRTAQQVAKRALILGSIAFRSSLEVTNHPRVVEISERLLPWLSTIECDDELDPIERDLLTTPLGQLSDAQRTDANWAGESASLFCWMLNLGERPSDTDFADPSGFPDTLRILKPEAIDILRSASLRDRADIEDACRHFVLIRSMLQELRIEPAARSIIRRANVQRLGLDVTEEAVRSASDAVARMTPEARARLAGVYFVRYHASTWFFDDRKNYFA